ncbi:M23 family metallopeptidase [Cellulomonas iranensis]|uniref:M23 family metallopeptidase n=1 Tax=Cellulomonas iranensis TaxID=76862 RepID=UPI0013D1B8C9|nr:M23 family metallopeptidase [Cellulomonas iranensis]
MAGWALPVRGGYRTSGYGPRSSPGGVGSTWHRGVDVGGRGTDLLVRSVGPGTVLAIGTNAVRGRWVAVRHDDGTTTAYQHLDEVRATGRVDAGTPLGVMGTTGRSTARHLHLEAFPVGRFVRVGDAFASTDRTVDPEPYLRERGVDLQAGTTQPVTNPVGGRPGGSLPTVSTRPVEGITAVEDDDMRAHLIYHPNGTVAVLRPALGEMQILRTADEPGALIAAGLVDPDATVDLRPGKSTLVWDMIEGTAKRAGRYVP